MKWLVTWLIITYGVGACPPTVHHDPYLGETVTPNLNLMACYTEESKTMERYFSTYEEALEFVENGKPLCNEGWVWGYGQCVKDFKIVEVIR